MGPCVDVLERKINAVVPFVIGNVYFLSSSDKREMIWGVGRIGQLLNVVKKFHRPKETMKRKSEIDLCHERESYF